MKKKTATVPYLAYALPLLRAAPFSVRYVA